MTRTSFVLIALLLAAVTAAQPAAYPTPVDGDFIVRDFTFASGDRLPEVKLHYRTVGTPRKDADGVGLAALVWAGLLAPRVVPTFEWSNLLRDKDPRLPAIEESRELLGLLLGA